MQYKVHDYCKYQGNQTFNASRINLTKLFPPTEAANIINDIFGSDFASLFPTTTSISQNNETKALAEITSQYMLDDSKTTWKALAPYQDINVSVIRELKDDSYMLNISRGDWGKIQPYDELYLIGTFYWTDFLNPFEEKQQVYQNLVYKIKLVERFVPLVTANTTQVLIGEDLQLDGSKSHSQPLSTLHERNFVPSDQQKEGLSYYWTCPEVMKAACDQHLNLKYLNIRYQDFESTTKGAFNQRLTFYLQVFRSIDRDVNLSLIPKVSIQVEWLKIFRPQFSLNIPTITPSNQILVSQENKFIINYLNYAVTDTNLEVEWKIDSQIPSQMMTKSKFHEVLTLEPNSLKYNTKYWVNVTVINKEYKFAAKTVSYKFTTGNEPPKNGSVSMIPLTGTFAKTTFSFGISNWVVPKMNNATLSSLQSSIRYIVKGKLQNSNQMVLITDRDYGQKEYFFRRIPQVSSLYFEIFTDESAEFTSYEMPVTAQSDDNLYAFSETFNTGSTINQALENVEVIEMKLLSLNARDFDKLPQDTALQMRTNVMNFLFNMTNQSKLVHNDSRLQTKIANIINIATVQNKQLSDGLAISAQQLLGSLLRIPEVSITALENLASSASNLLIYNSFVMNDTSNYTELNMRFLQAQSYMSQKSRIAQLLQYVKRIADIKCDDTTNEIPYLNQERILTDAFEIILERIPSDNLVFNRTYIKTGDFQNQVILPLRDMLAARNGQSFCNQVVFYKKQPFGTWKFFTQTMVTDFQPVIVQISQYSPSEVMQFNRTVPFKIDIQYDYNMTKSHFRHNQTLIMSIQQSGLNFNQSTRWSENTCSSEQVFDHRNQLMSANCQIEASTNQLRLFAILTDYSRTLVLDKSIFNLDDLLEDLQNFDPVVLPIIIVLFVFNFIVPIIVTCIDRSDFNNIKKQQLKGDVSDEMLKRIAVHQSLQFDHVRYRRYQYAQCLEVKDQSLTKIFCLYLRNIHPLIGLFRRFDIEQQRIVRYMTMSLQLSTVAIIAAIYFSFYESTSNADVNSKDILTAIILGLVLSLVLLPIPQSMTCCMRTKLITEKQDNEDLVDYMNSAKKLKEDPPKDQDVGNHGKSKLVDTSQMDKESDQSRNQIDISAQLKQHQDLYEGGEPVDVKDIQIRKKGQSSDGSSGPAKYKFNSSGELSQQQQYVGSNSDKQVLIETRCLCCKVFLVIVALLFAILTIAIVALISGIQALANSEAMTITFCTSLINGYFTLNFLRVFVNAKIAPRVAMDVHDNEDETGNYDHQNYGKCAKTWLSPDAVEIMLDVLIVNQIEESSFIAGREEIIPKKRVVADIEKGYQSRQKPGDKIKLSQTDRTQIDDGSQINDVSQDYILPSDNLAPVGNTRKTDQDVKRNASVALVDRRSKYRTNNAPDHLVLDDNGPDTNSIKRDTGGYHSKDESQTNNTYASRKREGRRQRGDSQVIIEPSQPTGNIEDLRRQERRKMRQQRFQDDSDQDETGSVNRKVRQSSSVNNTSPKEKSVNSQKKITSRQKSPEQVNPFVPAKKSKHLGEINSLAPHLQDSPDLSFTSSIEDAQEEQQKSYSRRQNNNKNDPTSARKRNEKLRGLY